MKVYNQEKTKVLEKYDLEKGYLKDDVLQTIIPAQEKIEETGHYETIAEYPNGGKDVKWVIDQPGQEEILEHIEEEKIQVYIPYSKEELLEKEKRQRIGEYKSRLAETDYKAMKYMEGFLSEEEYLEVKINRQFWRNKIRQLENRYTENLSPEEIKEQMLAEAGLEIS